MNLAEFVRITMEQKQLSQLDVERNSGKLITDTTVATVLAGNANNPTLKVILGLAKGLDVHPIEVFKAAAEVDEPTEAWTPEMLWRAYQKMVTLKPAEIKQIKKILKLS